MIKDRKSAEAELPVSANLTISSNQMNSVPVARAKSIRPVTYRPDVRRHMPGHRLCPAWQQPMMVKALAESLLWEFSSHPITPDLMPSDHHGHEILQVMKRATDAIWFRRGPGIANLILS